MARGGAILSHRHAVHRSRSLIARLLRDKEMSDGYLQVLEIVIARATQAAARFGETECATSSPALGVDISSFIQHGGDCAFKPRASSINASRKSFKTLFLGR